MTKNPSRPNSPTKYASEQPSSSTAPTQGISSRLFGMLKRFPMTMTSPSKEIPSLSPPQDQSSLAEEQSDSEGDEEDDDEQDEEQDDDEEGSVTESEEEDPLGDEQCQAIMDNFLLETSTRTQLLRNRIQTHYRPALRRRLDFELSRITPSIANVTALDYHERDEGVLRRTMEHVARMAIEQTTLSIGLKRSQSEQELVWNEIEQNHHHKRKRQLTGNTESTASKSKSQAPSPLIGSSSALNGRPLSRSKPPTSRSTQAGQHRQRSTSSIETTELNPRLPSTPLMSEGKPARLARRNESLISVNGSPVLSLGPDDKQVMPTSTSSLTVGSKFSELFPSTTSVSIYDDYLAANALGRPLENSTQISQFTFVEKSKWKELESQLKSLQIEQSQRKKLDELLQGCLNFGDS